MTTTPRNQLLPIWISQGFGLGRTPLAPGTAASAAALGLALFLESLGGLALVAAAFAAFSLAGYWSIRCLPDKGARDAPEIVVDEIAGQFLAVLPLSAVLIHVEASPVALWPGWAMSFALFRLLDTLKPWPISVLDRRQGAVWIMADDLAAGALAGAGTLLAGWAFHGMYG